MLKPWPLSQQEKPALAARLPPGKASRLNLLGTFMLCSEACLVNHGLAKVRAITLRCRCWSCGLCRPMRKARLCADMADGRPNKLLTLTTRVVEGGDRVAEARRQGVAFGALIRLIRRRCDGQELAFFAVREATEQGWPHLHVALRSPYIPQAWLAEKWEELTGSFVVDIRKIWRAGGVAGYLAKYIGKAPQRFGSTKRYWYSRNWFDERPPLPPRDRTWDSRWSLVTDGIERLAEVYWLKKWELTMSGRFGSFEARAPP